MITNINGVGGSFPPVFWDSGYSAAIHVWSNESQFAQEPFNGDVYNQTGVLLIEDPPVDFPGSSSGGGWNNFYTTFLFNAFPLEAGDYIVALVVTTNVQFFLSESDVPLATGPDIFAYSSQPGQWFEISSFPGRPTGTAAADILGCPETPGDINIDCYLDLDDFTVFAHCMAGPDVTTPPPGCDPADFAAADNDVDMGDFAAFQIAFTGPAP